MQGLLGYLAVVGGASMSVMGSGPVIALGVVSCHEL